MRGYNSFVSNLIEFFGGCIIFVLINFVKYMNYMVC